MVLADDAYGNFREQLRLGISPTGFRQLLRDLGDSTGHSDLIKDWGRWHGVRRRVTRCLDQRSHKPIHNDAGELGMDFEQVGSVTAVGGNFADVEGFIPYPRRVLRRRVVYELLAWVRRGD